MMDQALDIGKIIIADLILSGDNALIIGMAAAGLSPELRKKAILCFAIVLGCLTSAKADPIKCCDRAITVHAATCDVVDFNV